jgi:hypothetical protein
MHCGAPLASASGWYYDVDVNARDSEAMQCIGSRKFEEAKHPVRRSRSTRFEESPGWNKHRFAKQVALQEQRYE